MKNLTVFKLEPTTSNVLQHVVTRLDSVAECTRNVALNNAATCCVEMLRSFNQGVTQFS